MLKRFMERKEDEDGFTLIELMVVVLIIGILIAIALPTFLGARSRAQDRAAQSSLRNALVTAKTFFTDGDTYTGLTGPTMLALEPSLTYQDTVSTGPTNISVNVTGAVYGSAALSDSTKCFWLKDDPASGTKYGVGGTCTGAAAQAAALAKW